MFINNEFVAAKDGSTLNLENPFNGEHLAVVSSAQGSDVDAAVAAASTAFYGPWKTTSPEHRGRLLNRLADLIEEEADAFATLEALDAGILFEDSKGKNVPQAVSTLRYFAGWADKIAGQLLHISLGFGYTQRDPIGVCAAIVPWNSPL